MQRREFLKKVLVIALSTPAAKLLGFDGKEVAKEPIIFEGRHKDWIFIGGYVGNENAYTMCFWCRAVVKKFKVKKQVAILASEIRGFRVVGCHLSQKDCKVIFNAEKKSYG